MNKPKDEPKSLEEKELKELIEQVRDKKNQDIWYDGDESTLYKTQKIEDLAIIELALTTYESQEKLNKLTTVLVILTGALIVLTAILIYDAFFT